MIEIGYQWTIFIASQGCGGVAPTVGELEISNWKMKC